ncbi:MAG: glycosyltransferase family 1 protein [Spirochaetales bacterium]|nr:glycosyltransferase family 1 protein [Spirochaetales bacterium]
MKIAILTIGSRGDTQPYIALAMGLMQNGFDVKLVVPENVAALVHEANISCATLPIDVKASIEKRSKDKKFQKGIFQKIRIGKKRIKKELPPLIDESLVACEGADLILYGGISFSFYFQIQEFLQTPNLPLFLQPITFTKKMAPMFLPVSSLGSLVNSLAHHWMICILWTTYRHGINAWRKTRNLEKITKGNPFKKLFSKQQTMLYGYSPNVFPSPRDWSPLQYPAGYWFWHKKDDYQPPESLVDFLEAGPAPVYIGFGSMGGILGEDTIEIVTKAVKLSKCRAVFLTGWGQEASDRLSPDIYCMEQAPHDWLFPRMAALVHHGGAGTTAAGLRAGKPAQIISHISDQMFWSFRLVALKAGLRFIDRKKLTAAKLARSIKILLNNKDLSRGAAAISEKLQQEDGVANAVSFIQSYIERYVNSN